jgi:hypothetical protein
VIVAVAVSVGVIVGVGVGVGVDVGVGVAVSVAVGVAVAVSVGNGVNVAVLVAVGVIVSASNTPPACASSGDTPGGNAGVALPVRAVTSDGGRPSWLSASLNNTSGAPLNNTIDSSATVTSRAITVIGAATTDSGVL